MMIKSNDMRLFVNINNRLRPALGKTYVLILGLWLSVFGMAAPPPVRAQEATWTKPEAAVRDQIRNLRNLPDDVRARTTRRLALDIRALPSTPHKLDLAFAVSNLSTEGDFGHDTLQEVATTLADALRADPQPMMGTEPAPPYVELAQLVRYEHVKANVDNPQFTAALAKLEADDQNRQRADFTLTDLQGKNWTLQGLRGKVVLVNFWATWCDPCRREMPDLEALYQRFKSQGLVVLAVSDDEVAKVKQLIAEKKFTYPVLLDPGRKVNDMFRIDGIPKSFVYDREGKLVAQAIDMRTRGQFLEMLSQAGLR
jgi:peroxiredoxin